MVGINPQFFFLLNDKMPMLTDVFIFTVFFNFIYIGGDIYFIGKDFGTSLA